MRPLKPTGRVPWAFCMTDFFDYDLPQHLIAQQPCAERDQARLLVLHRETGSLEHRIFYELPELLNPGDLLVLNDTRVLPARLLGRRERTGGKWEGLFLRLMPDDQWELLGQTRGRLIAGEIIVVEPGGLRLEFAGRSPEGRWLFRPLESGSPVELLTKYGQTPLPPYIRKGRAEAGDRERYQTVYAHNAGSVAAPTAGLHFTERLFEKLAQRDIERAFVTLHIGLGTFQPIQVEDYTHHKMHREWGELSAATAEVIHACKRRGGYVVAVGTSSVRVLETAAASGRIGPWCGETELFIYPPLAFRAVDALMTNFHLPRSTLLLLVGAFAGVELIREAYKTAVEREYRFFSYGDAMLIV
jgi:S-adenosylmethionine:tRNA ribosyltransferase-isomerase